MKRTPAIILTLVTILLCGCPGLAFCAGSLDAQAFVAMMQAQGYDFPGSLLVSRLGLGLIALVLIAIPIVVGLITLRKSNGGKKQPVVASRPPQMPPARPATPVQPAVVSRPAPVTPAYQPPAPAPKAEPLPPVYQPPAPAPEPKPLPPVYQPPAPAPEPEPLPPVYEPPAAAPEPEPLPPVYQPPAPAPEPEPLPPFYETPAPASEPEPLPPVQDQPPAPEAAVAPPAEQPGTAFPPMLDGATRLASSWSLAFVSGPSPVNTIVLGKKVSLGRSADNDVTLLDPLVSRQHALVELIGGGYLVTDLHSANGTFVNDAPLTGAVRLRVGDLVKFGGTVFRFQPYYEMP